MKKFKNFIATILIITLGLNGMVTFGSDLYFDDAGTFGREETYSKSFAECFLGVNIFWILSYNENKMEILNAFNKLIKEEQPHVEGFTLELFFKFSAYLLMVLKEAKVPIDEINVDDFMFKEDNSLNFTFIWIINSYIKYVEENELNSKIDISEVKKLLEDLKLANDYFATHKN